MGIYAYSGVTGFSPADVITEVPITVAQGGTGQTTASAASSGSHRRIK